MRVIATVIGPLKKHVGMYQWTVDWLQSIQSLKNTIKIFQEKLWWSLSWTDMTASQLTPRWFCKLSFFTACHWLPNRFIRQQIVAKLHHHLPPGCKDLRKRVHRLQRDQPSWANDKRREGRSVRRDSERVGHRQDGRWPRQEPLLRSPCVLLNYCPRERNKCFKFCWPRPLLAMGGYSLLNIDKRRSRHRSTMANSNGLTF